MRSGGSGWLPAGAVLAVTLVTGFVIGSGQLSGLDRSAPPAAPPGNQAGSASDERGVAGVDPAEADPAAIGSGPPSWGITTDQLYLAALPPGVAAVPA